LCRHARVEKIKITHPSKQKKQYKDSYKELEKITKKEGTTLLTP
jgi:hypothetical protein